MLAVEPLLRALGVALLLTKQARAMSRDWRARRASIFLSLKK
jgi:hypothetical protein